MTTTNKGDYGYWKGVRFIKDLDGNPVVPRRELYATAPGMKDVVFPGYDDYEGDVVPLDGHDYAYYWWREGTDEPARSELGDLKLKGYDFATTENFKLVYPGWWEENGRIYNGARVLLACPSDRYDENKRKEQDFWRRTGRFDEIDQHFAEEVQRTARETGIALEPLEKTVRKAARK